MLAVDSILVCIAWVPVLRDAQFSNSSVRYIQMLSLVPSDPDTLFHLGGLLDSEGDKQAAYQYYFDVSCM